MQSNFHKQFITHEFEHHYNHHQYHKLLSMSSVNNQIFIIANGINFDDSISFNISNERNNNHDSDDDDNNNHKNQNQNHIFIYGSAPNRGLEYVLQQWKRIKKSIPSAELHIYYGFTSIIITNLKKSMGINQFNSWYLYIQTMIQQDKSIIYHGHVDHDTLNNAYNHAGFLLYPTTFQETGCITVLRAMSCGCIPISSRLIPSVLYDLTMDYDLGPKYYPLNMSIVLQQNKIHHSNNHNHDHNNDHINNEYHNDTVQSWLEYHWTPAVISAFNMNHEMLEEHRMKMKNYINSIYTWKQSAQSLSNYFH